MNSETKNYLESLKLKSQLGRKTYTQAELTAAVEAKEREVTEYYEGILAMTVASLEGIVEGQPTSRINFLQRVRELVRIEADTAALRDALAELLDAYRTRYSDIDGHMKPMYYEPQSSEIGAARAKAEALLASKRGAGGETCLD